jgi:prophage regulatory protein
MWHWQAHPFNMNGVALMDLLVLSQIGFVRLSAILPPGPIPVSRSAWCQPAKLGPRTTVWRAEDIRAPIEQTGATAWSSRARHAGCKRFGGRG